MKEGREIYISPRSKNVNLVYSRHSGKHWRPVRANHIFLTSNIQFSIFNFQYLISNIHANFIFLTRNIQFSIFNSWYLIFMQTSSFWQEILNSKYLEYSILRPFTIFWQKIFWFLIQLGWNAIWYRKTNSLWKNFVYWAFFFRRCK